MMEDETWLTVFSSDESCDSDKIDSDIEAELYGVIHHGAETVTSPIDHSISQAAIEIIKSPKHDEIYKTSPTDTNLYTNFENSKRKECEGSSSSDEVQIISDGSNGKKRKSEVLNNIIKDIQLENDNGNSSKLSNGTNPCKKQRTNSNENLQKKSCAKSDLNETVVVDTSDSDSIIWTEVDECDIKLKTNLDHEDLMLSSDSFSSDDCSSPFLGDNSLTSPAKSSQPSTSSFSISPNGPWYVNSEDMYRRTKGRSSRYHERAVLQCSNCNLKGHSVKFCTVPKAVKCYICGGAHIGSRCKDRVCVRCFQPGHDSRFCNQHFISICFHCNMRGHAAKHCPDLWRRYHLTTNQRNIVVGRTPVQNSTPIYCFNCGQKGHYGAQCQAHRTDRLSYRTWTSVIEYVHPYDTIQRVNENQRNTALGGIPMWSPTPSYIQPGQQQMPVYRQTAPQIKMPVYRQTHPQIQMPLNRQTPPQIQMPLKKQTALQSQLLPKKKKNKKKNKGLANNLQTPPANMKKNKANNSPQTPGSSTKKKTQKEVYFPRTPKTSEKKLRNKFQRKQMKTPNSPNSFMNGLHKRLGLLN